MLLSLKILEMTLTKQIYMKDSTVFQPRMNIFTLIEQVVDLLEMGLRQRFLRNLNIS